MGRYIDANLNDEELLDFVQKQTADSDTFITCRKILNSIPEADVEPVRHGHWEKECRSQIIFPDGEVATLIERRCSNCHRWSNKEIFFYSPRPAKYCAECGAKMDEEKTNG